MSTEMISQKVASTFNENNEATLDAVSGDKNPNVSEDVPTYAEAFPPLSSGVSNGSAG